MPTIAEIQEKQKQIHILQQQIACKKAIAAEKEQTMKNILAKYNVASFEELNALYQKNLTMINEEAVKYDSYIQDMTNKLKQIEGYVNVQ